MSTANPSACRWSLYDSYDCVPVLAAHHTLTEAALMGKVAHQATNLLIEEIVRLVNQENSRWGGTKPDGSFIGHRGVRSNNILLSNDITQFTSSVTRSRSCLSSLTLWAIRSRLKLLIETF